MKNNIKKIIVAVFSLVLLFIAGQNAFAATNSVTWNTMSNDCSTIAIANKTQNIGFGNGTSCWTGQNISANSGDTIRVRVYYHNTGTSTANNTKIRIIKSPNGNTSTNYTFSGQIISDSGTFNSTNPSGVYLTIPAGKTLDYVTTYWYPDQTSTGNGSAFLYGQNGSEVLGSGLRIGNIEPGWDSQGTVIAEFKVNNAQTPNCIIDNFTANPNTITSGQSSTLSWNTTNCNSVSINQGIGNVSVDGTRTVSPTQTTTYTLTATGSNGSSATRTATVNVNTVNNTCVINNFIATPQNINQGGSSNLGWYTSDCAYLKLYNGNNLIGTYYGMAGNQAVTPNQTTTYTLKGHNANGSVSSTKTVTVTVNPVIQNCTINSFTANPNTITSGQSSTLAWSTTNCTNVTISNLGYNVPVNGTQAVWPTVTTTYTLTATGSNGQSQTRSVTVNVKNIITPKCQINSFTANPNTITSGQSSTLSWSTTNCDSVSISPSIGNVSVNGSRTVSPTSTTTYILTAGTINGPSLSRSVTITVNPVIQNCAINSFTANPNTITSGQSSTLAWSTTNCTNVTISNLGYNVPVNGTQAVWPTTTTTYVLTASGIGGKAQTRSVTVNVKPVSQVCIINSFTANPTNINPGASSVLSWSTSGCESVALNGTEVSAYGSQTVWPTNTTTYTLIGKNSYGIAQTKNVTVTVNSIVSPSCTINSFTANPASLNSAGYSTLNWSTDNCNNVTISNLGYNVPTSGSQSVWVSETTSYILTATSSYGIPQTRNLTIYVNENNNSCRITDFSASDTRIDEGDSTNLYWQTENCERVKISNIGDVSLNGNKRVYPTSTRTYTITAYNFNGSTVTDSIRIYVDEEDNDNDDCRIDSFTADRTYINRGDSVNLRWRTTDCDDVSITNYGSVDDDGSETFYPNSTMTYTLRARGDNGSDSESIRITVGDGNDVIYNTNVVTTIATNISQNSAQVNGLITNTNYGNATTYFEYGTTVNMGMRTASRSTGGNSYFNEYLTNLSPNTIYFFRAVGEGSGGVSRGAIEVFRTLGYVNTNWNNTNTNTTNTRIIREVVVEQGNTVYGSLSPIMLQIENRYQSIGVGDVIDYTVFYKNISISRLTNPMVQVYVPKGITITNSSRGTFSNESRTLSVPIGDLNPNDEGVIYLQAVVEELDANLAQIVTTAVLIYTNPNQAQENAMAYVLNNPRVVNVNNLGAVAFFGNIFGLSLIGWLLLIILIMLLILLSRTYYGRRNTTTKITTEKIIN